MDMSCNKNTTNEVVGHSENVLDTRFIVSKYE